MSLFMTAARQWVELFLISYWVLPPLPQPSPLYKQQGTEQGTVYGNLVVYVDVDDVIGLPFCCLSGLIGRFVKLCTEPILYRLVRCTEPGSFYTHVPVCIEIFSAPQTSHFNFICKLDILDITRWLQNKTIALSVFTLL